MINSQKKFLLRIITEAELQYQKFYSCFNHKRQFNKTLFFLWVL